MTTTSHDGKPPAEIVRQKLGLYMGPFTAKNAVQMGAKLVAGTDADRLTLAQIPALIDAIGPTLRTLLGKTAAEKVAAEIRAELSL